jgi:hypothetical protein
MKLNHFGLNSLVLGAFVFVGFISGRNLVDTGKSILGLSPEVTAHPQDYIVESIEYPVPYDDEFASESSIQPNLATAGEAITQAPAQMNTLIVFVDNLETDQSNLDGLWLMMYFSDSTHLTFMPIYPSFPTTGETSDNNNQLMKNNFLLNPDHTLSGSFSQFLYQNNYRWDTYIILDKHALVDVVDFWISTAGSNADNAVSSSIVSSYPPVETDAELSLLGQTKILQTICQSMAVQPVLPDTTGLLTKTADHLVTNLQVDQFINQWQIKLNQGNRSSCEFPYLNYR